MKLGLVITMLSLAASTLTPSSEAASQLPVEAFAALPTTKSLALSPDGSKIAMLVNQQGTTSLVVKKLDQSGAPPKALLATDNRKFTFKWFHWVNDDKLLVSTMFPDRLIVNGYTGGVDVYETRLLAVNADGSQVTNLIKPNSIKGALPPQFQDRVIDFDPDNGKHVTILLADQERSLDPGVYSLDLENATRRTLLSAREHFRNWMVDRQHQVRLGVYQNNTDIEIHVCDPDGKNWRKRWSYQALSLDAVTPLGFGKDPNQLYILANYQGRKAVFTVNLANADAKPKLVLANSLIDLSGELVYSDKTGEAIGLLGSSVEGEAEINYWDKDRRELVKFIDDALPKRFNRIISLSKDENRYLVQSGGGQTPDVIYLGDDHANTLEEFVQNYPALPAAAMTGKQGVTINARDGLKLPAFLSLPQTSDGKSLPAVLLIHGDSLWNEDTGFDTWTQFLTNRGYAVLQVNVRGSTGYGNQLMASGLKQWGQESQDDLSDAVKWLVQRGTADPRRICIVGASYGGYAALMGVTKTPELYQCAVSFAGVTDLFEFGQDRAYYLNGKAMFEARIGSLDQEKEKLKATSPRFLAKDIKAPVLLIHGTQDRSVSFGQAVMMDAALNEAGKAHKFIKQDGGDHHLSLYEHRLQFFRELESFLEQNLKTAKQ